MLHCCSHVQRRLYFSFHQLTFKKGDLITVTQREDGGWWEGTSQETGKTGWFPTNYVKEVDESSCRPSDANAANLIQLERGADGDGSVADVQSKQAQYRQQLINELITKELDFVQELRTLAADFLHPLHQHPEM